MDRGAWKATVQGSQRVRRLSMHAPTQIIILNELSQRQISYDITYMCSLLKMIQMSLLQRRNSLTDIENKLMVTKGGRNGGEIN